MNRQQLSEALAEYERTLDVKRFYDFEDMKVEAVHTLAAAARLVERLLPGECEFCKGHGILGIHVHTDPETGAHLGDEEEYCKPCRGSGRVWDEGIVDHFASVIFNAEFAEVDWATIKAEYAEDGANFEDHHRFYYDAARAVLSALVELLTEKVET